MPKIRDGGFRSLGTGFGAAQSLTSLPYLNSNKAVGKARGQISKVAGQVNDAISTAHKINTGVNQAASAVGDVLGLFKKEDQSVGNTDIAFPSYKVHIRSNGENISPVMGYLQGDSLNLSLKSQWESAFSMLNSFARVANAPAQYAAGTTLKPRALTRRIWTGNNPLTLTLPLKFQAVSDTFKNVIEPCIALQLMISPRIGELGFLVPPGPKPMYGITEALGKKIESVTGVAVEKVIGGGKKFIEEETTATKNILKVANSIKTKFVEKGDNIRIDIGKFLRFEHVVITDLDIKYGTKFDTDGNPVSAEANITFETFEVLTQDSIRAMYQLYNPF